MLCFKSLIIVLSSQTILLILKHMYHLILCSNRDLNPNRHYCPRDFPTTLAFTQANLVHSTIHFIGTGVWHLFSKFLWSGLFYYHIRNLARYSFIFSFSYCKLSEIKSLLLHNLDSTIISNLDISSIVSTHLWTFLLHLIGSYSYHYYTLGNISVQLSSSLPKPMSP